VRRWKRGEKDDGVVADFSQAGSDVYGKEVPSVVAPSRLGGLP